MRAHIFFNTTEKVGGQNGIGTMLVNCSRVFTYNSEGLDGPYMEIVIENPEVMFSELSKVVE